MMNAQEKKRRDAACLNGWWTGFAASINGQRFIITWCYADGDYEIKLPNGKKTIVARGLPDAIST